MPSMRAPIAISRRARSWTCGSDAALWITVEPGVSAAAIRAFSVAMTEGSSMKKSHACSPSGAARRNQLRSTFDLGAERAEGIQVRVEPPAADHVAAGRRHVGAAEAREQRAGEQERGADPLGPVAVHLELGQVRGLEGHDVVVAPLHVHAEVAQELEHRLHVGDARDVAQHDLLARQETRGERGQCGVLVACRRDGPRQGRPAFDYELLHLPARSGARRGYPAMMPQPTRDEAWDMVCEWTQSESLRKHMLGVETAMRAYARKFGEDEELYAVTGLLHDLDYERYPDLGTGHPRVALKLFEERGYPQELIEAVAGHATFLGVPRETRMAKTLYAVDELSGFIAACAYVRPDGIHGMTPKSVKKKLKQPSFAAGVNRDEVREGAEELGVDFDEHVAFVIAAMDERADELGLGPRQAA